MSKVETVTTVVVAEVWADGVLIFTGTYPNATKRQAMSYASASAPAQEWLKQGYHVEVKARRFGPLDDVECSSVVPK